MRRSGFAIHECGALVLILAVIACVLLITGADHRRLARLGDDIANLKTVAAASGQYTADNADLFWTFSWRRGPAPISPTDPYGAGLLNAADDLQAAANQAIYIIRRRSGRPPETFAPITAWVPHIIYTHLVLADSLEQKIPWRPLISSADRERLKWASDPECFDTGCFLPCQPPPSPISRRWPYSSSFQVPTVFYDLSPIGTRINQQGLPYSQYWVFSTGSILSGVQMSAVSFPSQKVLLHDQNARHFGSRQPYCTHPEARLPLLFVDGSVQVRSAADSNPGWNPNSPTGVTSMTYNPGICWDPAPLNPAGDNVIGRFRYTRQGIAGRDFGGPEVN
jgi:hypothetical protein